MHIDLFVFELWELSSLLHLLKKQNQIREYCAKSNDQVCAAICHNRWFLEVCKSTAIWRKLEENALKVKQQFLEENFSSKKAECIHWLCSTYCHSMHTSSCNEIAKKPYLLFSAHYYDIWTDCESSANLRPRTVLRWVKIRPLRKKSKSFLQWSKNQYLSHASTKMPIITYQHCQYSHWPLATYYKLWGFQFPLFLVFSVSRWNTVVPIRNVIHYINWLIDVV